MPSIRPPIGAGTPAVQPIGARRLLLLLLAVLLVAGWRAAAHAVDPLSTMRAFCQADGRGERLDPPTWPRVADLVTWPLEPAWDHLYLIRGFEFSAPQVRDGDVQVDVQYVISGEVRSSVVEEVERVETRTYHLLRGDDGNWRIRAPAPPPHVFATTADASALAALLDPAGSTYVSNSAFAWRMLRDAGWAIEYANVSALPTAPGFASERTARVGDLALYYDRDRPYHVGIVESDDTMVSATLNGGIRRTPFGAFAGEIRYLRPVAIAASTPLVDAPPTPRKK